MHAIWSILTTHKKGYSRHPETLRWVGRLKALYIVHENIVAELNKRGFKHSSLLNIKLARGFSKQDRFVDSLSAQKKLLRSKGCACQV